MSSFPLSYTIQTPRLTLLTPQPVHATALHAYLTNPAHYGSSDSLTRERVAEKIDDWAVKTAAGESAFLIIVRSTAGEDGGDEEIMGFGGFNSLPWTKMLASEERKGDAEAAGEKVKVGDMGISFAPKWQRQGFAREAICAMTEFGFSMLGCGYMHMDTERDNDGFRALMRDIGIPEKEGSGVEVEDAVLKFAWKSVNFDWDRTMWETVKEGLVQRGK